MDIYREYRVVIFRSPAHTVHSGAISSEAEAVVRFTNAKKLAKSDPGIKRIALFGFTKSKTVLLDQSMRLGGIACKLSHETPRIRLNPIRKAA